MRYVEANSIRRAVASSLLLHAVMFVFFMTLAAQWKNLREREYIPIELIPSSGTRLQRSPRAAALPAVRPTVTPKQITAPQAAQPPDMPAAVNKLPLASPDAPAQQPSISSSVVSDGQPGSAGASTGDEAYQPFHRVSRVPEFKVQKKPAYPSSERASGVEARVVVEVFINETGGVDKVKLVKSGGVSFDNAVLAAVSASSFEPGYLEDKPVAVRVQIPYSFRLH